MQDIADCPNGGDGGPELVGDCGDEVILESVHFLSRSLAALIFMEARSSSLDFFSSSREYCTGLGFASTSIMS